MPVPTSTSHPAPVPTKYTNGAATTTNTTNTRTIDFNNLTLASLRKYKRVHHLRIKPTVSKAELVQHVTAHFFTPDSGADRTDFEPDEEQIIDGFVMAVRQRSVAAMDDSSNMTIGTLAGTRTIQQQQKVKKSKPALEHKRVKPKKTKKSKRIGRAQVDRDDG